LNQAFRSRRRAAGALVTVGATGSMIMMGLSAATPASASTPAKAVVGQGLALAEVPAKSVFPVKASKKETVSFVLKMRHEGSLEAKASAGIRRGFLSVAGFARQYGQTQQRIRSLESYLAHYKIKTRAYADGLDVTATGTAGEFNKALSVTQGEYKSAVVPARDGQPARPAVTFHATKDAPLLPVSLASFVETVVGLNNYPLFVSDAVHTRAAEPARAPAGTYNGNRTPASFARTYDLSPLYKKRAYGQGQTIGIITFASVRPSDATHFWSKTLKLHTASNRIRLDNIDGGSGAVSANNDSDETTLDVEQSGALAPLAHLVVYQAPNSDVGNIDAYAAAASQNVAGSVSTSWGESETLLASGDVGGTEPTTLIQANDEFMLEMAAQGQANFTAAGDYGAYAASGDLLSTNLSVQNTADSPWTTAAGGTTLPGTIPVYSQVNGLLGANVRVVRERAWGWDWQWPYYSLFECTVNTSSGPVTQQCPSEALFATQDALGGGGGYSTAEARPGYQSRIKGIGDYSAVPYLTPTDPGTEPGSKLVEPTAWTAWDASSGSATPPAVIHGSAKGRVVPDLSADADPDTGYEIYFLGQLALGWGGTSFVAPELNGSAAVIDSYLHHRVGFWNPALYQFAAASGSPFTPLDTSAGSNDNLYFTGTKGTIFNPATGLGTPNLAKLAAEFARHGW
jgi:subtilase family serine protease